MNQSIRLTNEQLQKLTAVYDVYLCILMQDQMYELKLFTDPLFEGILPHDHSVHLVGYFTDHVYLSKDFDDHAPDLIAHSFFENDPPFAYFSPEQQRQIEACRLAYRKSGIPFSELVSVPNESTAHNLYLGISMLYGYGSKKDPRRGAALIRAEAEKGVPCAIRLMFYLCRGGLGTVRDYDEAVFWHRRFTETITPSSPETADPYDIAMYANALYLDTELSIRLRRIEQAKKTLRLLHQLCRESDVASPTRQIKWCRYFYHDLKAQLAQTLGHTEEHRKELLQRDRIYRSLPIAKNDSEEFMLYALYDLAHSLAFLHSQYEALGVERTAEEYLKKSEFFAESARDEAPRTRWDTINLIRFLRSLGRLP